MPVRCKDFWKVSVFDRNFGTFRVEVVCVPNEKEAKFIADLWTQTGVQARASRHINQKGEYYYGCAEKNLDENSDNEV